MHKKYNIIFAVFITIVLVVAIILVALPGDIPLPGTAGPTESPALSLPLAERLNSTYLLLHEPVGGFRGPLMWINGPDNVTFDYTFYSRDYGPGNVTLTIYEVSNPLNITPITPSPGISARMIPNQFTALPGTEISAHLIVNISPEGYRNDTVTKTFYVHANVTGETNAIADDWIRVRMGDRPDTYMSYITNGEIGEQNITISREGNWAGNLTIRTGERGTGPLLIWVKELDCGTMFFSSLDTPAPFSPGSPAVSIDPAQFIARSFGDYEIPVAIDANSPGVQPGTYCYQIVISALDTSTSFSTTVQVIP